MVSHVYFSSCSATFSKFSENNNYYFYNHKNKISLVIITNERCNMGIARGGVLEGLIEEWIQMNKRRKEEAAPQECGSSHRTRAAFSLKPSPSSVLESEQQRQL